MSSYNASRLIAAPLLFAVVAMLSACGFKPIYGHNSPSQLEGTVADLAAIDIDTIPDRSGQMMRTELKRRLHPRSSDQSLYSLNITMSETISQLAINRASFATRANLSITASYTLTDNATGKPLTTGSITSMSSYNILNSYYATYAAQEDSRKRTIEALADDLRTRLSIYFNGPHKEPGKPNS